MIIAYYFEQILEDISMSTIYIYLSIYTLFNWRFIGHIFKKPLSWHIKDFSTYYFLHA